MSTRMQRLTFTKLDPRVQELLRARVDRLGYLGEFFQVTGVQPGLLAPFMELTQALKDALPDQLTEVGALTVATLMDNTYELHQHERLSVKLGFGEAWVLAVQQMSPETAPELSDAERAMQRLVIAMIENRGKNVATELEVLINAIGSEQAVAVMFLVGRYITHALIVNSLELVPPVPSIFGQPL